MKLTSKILVTLLFLIGLAPIAQAEMEKGTVSATNASLKSLPRSSAKKITALSKGEPVTIVSRSGQWMKIRTQGEQEGWVEMLNIKLPKSSWSRKASGFFSWFGNAKQSAAAPTMTVGIRGISEEDLQNATPNYAALNTMNAYVATDGQGRNFANSRNLQARNINFLGSK